MKKAIIVYVLLTAILSAQERVYLDPGGKIVNQDTPSVSSQQRTHTNPNLDTLSFWDLHTNNDEIPVDTSTFNPLDVVAQWFVAPVDLTIKAVAVNCINSGQAGKYLMVDLKIYKLNRETDELLGVSSDTQIGYYPSDELETGISPYKEDLHTSGDWISVNESDSPFGELLWEDSGFGVIVLGSDYTRVEMNLLAYEPVIAQGDIFTVCVRNISASDSSGIGKLRSGNVNIPGLKFFGGLTDSNIISDSSHNPGWWVLPDNAWDILVEVEYPDDLPPNLIDLSKLQTTLSTDPRKVIARMDGDVLAESIHLVYSVNENAESDSLLMDFDGTYYTTFIPGQKPGTKVHYHFSVTFLDQERTYTFIGSEYEIFEPKSDILLVLNGWNDYGYPADYYLPPDIEYDRWAYGPLSEKLVDNYYTIIELCSQHFKDYNKEIIRNWLDAAGYRNYFLAGEEWLGKVNGYRDSAYAEGDFEYDILGITHSYNDVAFDGISEYAEKSTLYPVENSVFGGIILDSLRKYNVDTLEYSSEKNYIDGFDVTSDTNVDLFVRTDIIGGILKKELKAAFSHRQLAGGNHIAFGSFDPLSVHRYSGDISTGPQIIELFLKWIPAWPMDVTESNEIPNEVSLGQNYPNPFNPATMIEYSIPVVDEKFSSTTTNVKLIIYDILGREVATLVNQHQKPGKYRVEFGLNGYNRSFPSGVYLYRITAGRFSETKKMMILK